MHARHRLPLTNRLADVRDLYPCNVPRITLRNSAVLSGVKMSPCLAVGTRLADGFGERTPAIDNLFLAFGGVLIRQ